MNKQLFFSCVSMLSVVYNIKLDIDMKSELIRFIGIEKLSAVQQIELTEKINVLLDYFLNGQYNDHIPD